MPFNRFLLLRSTPLLRSDQVLLSLPFLLSGMRTTDKNARRSFKNERRRSFSDRLPLVFAAKLIIKRPLSGFQGGGNRNPIILGPALPVYRIQVLIEWSSGSLLKRSLIVN